MNAHRTSTRAVEAVEAYTEVVRDVLDALNAPEPIRHIVDAAAIKAHWLTAKSDAQINVMLVAGRGGLESKRGREVRRDYEATYGSLASFEAYLHDKKTRLARDTGPDAA